MAKLGLITDGISRDLEHALQVMTEADWNTRSCSSSGKKKSATSMTTRWHGR